MANEEGLRRYQPEGDEIISDWIEITGILVPRYLVTEKTYALRMRRSGLQYDEQARIKADDSLNVDAGDTHGTYHNEAAWYQDQYAGLAQVLGDGERRSLYRPVLVPDLETIRAAMKELGVDPAETITLGSRVVCQFVETAQVGWVDSVGGEEDLETITIVPELEEKSGLEGEVSVVTVLGKAVLGHHSGEVVTYEVKDREKPRLAPHQVSVKIVSVS